MTENQTNKKLLENVVSEFAKAIDRFKKKEYQEAGSLFGDIVETYKNSDDYHVLEVQARAEVYRKICQNQLSEQEYLHPETHEEYLSDGLFYLNRGKVDKALERFKFLENENYENPYLNYLLAIAYMKKEDKGNCLRYLKTAVQKDKYYKTIAHNEPDFDRLFDNDEFISIIDLHESF